MQHPNDSPCPNISSIADLDRVVVALRENETFDRAQVAWLIALGYRWGYEARVDEENGSHPEPPVFTLGRWFDQAAERQKADAAARLPRAGDHKGGPVEWDDPVDLRAAA